MDYSQRLNHLVVSPQRDHAYSHSPTAYSSPTCSSGSQGGSPILGLAISGCHVEQPLNEMRFFAVPAQLPSQLVPEPPTFDFSYHGYANGPCFSTPCDPLPNLSEGSLGLYSPASMCASPSYNPVLEDGSRPGTFTTDMSAWLNTSCSDPTTPSEVITTSNNEQWGRARSTDARFPSDIPLMPMAPYLETTTRLSPFQARKPCKPDVNAWQDEIQPRIPSASTTPSKPASKSARSSQGSPDPVISASGLQCPECSKTFTRRSNCKEHQKMHNPEWRQNHPCEECPKSFGRSSDLKRHKDTVSQSSRSSWFQSLT